MIKLKKSLYFLIFFNSVLVSKNYYEKFDEALQLYKDGRYRLSEEYFRKLYELDRDYKDPASQLLIAKSQSQQGQWDKA